jgi:hypothetical protein
MCEICLPSTTTTTTTATSTSSTTATTTGKLLVVAFICASRLRFVAQNRVVHDVRSFV